MGKKYLVFVAGLLLAGGGKNLFGVYERPVSAPFISGDDFRACCKFILDEDTPIRNHKKFKVSRIYFDPADVRDGDAIFVHLALLDLFFSQYHPKIKARYILVSNNYVFSAPGEFKKFLEDDTLFAWFTQNCDYIHPKVIPVPLGLSNKHWRHSRNHTELLRECQENLRKKQVQKKYLFYVNIVVRTAPRVRQPVFDFFKDKAFCTLASHKPYREFYSDTMESKFVLSPHGGGLDCHRTWETLYLGSYPVVKTSTLDPLYDDLPVVIVRDWNEVTPEFLEKKYEEFSHKTFRWEKLYMDYWAALIKQYQQRAKDYPQK